jgi:peptidoglycan-N-acetylglucosamine deacetylase
MAQKIIETLIGRAPRFYRPPVGLSNPHLRKALINLQMKCVGWSSSVRDAGNRHPHTFKHFHLMARPGSVILLHDVLPKLELKDLYFVELEKLFIQIRKKGLTSVTVDKLFTEEAYL